MSDAPPPPVAPATTSMAAADASRRLLTLARRDAVAAGRAFDSLSVEAQVAMVCETPIAFRTRMIALASDPAELIPHLPEAELCFVIKSSGVDDAGWLVTYSTSAQLKAFIDLDAWKGLRPDRSALDTWMATLAEAGRETLKRAAQNLDPEMLVLYLRSHVDVALDPKDEDWQPPVGAQTLEGQFYLTPKRPGDDIAPILELLHSIFTDDYWLYFRLLQACIWELETELEEWALRWRSGRLEDLGFPSWEESMEIYGYLAPEKRSEIATAAIEHETPRWDLPVWLPNLPAAALDGYSIFAAMAELDGEARRSIFYAFVSLANKVAVANELDLGDADTLPRAIEKAAWASSLGLEWLTSEHRITTSEVLTRTSLDRLFRIGASLDPENARMKPSQPSQEGDGAESATPDDADTSSRGTGPGTP